MLVFLLQSPSCLPLPALPPSLCASPCLLRQSISCGQGGAVNLLSPLLHQSRGDGGISTSFLGAERPSFAVSKLPACEGEPALPPFSVPWRAVSGNGHSSPFPTGDWGGTGTGRGPSTDPESHLTGSESAQLLGMGPS